jgi:hypothetical protein
MAANRRLGVTRLSGRQLSSVPGDPAARREALPLLADTRRVSRISRTRPVPIRSHRPVAQPHVLLRRAMVQNKPARGTPGSRATTYLAIPLLACIALLGDSIARDRSFLRVDAVEQLPELLLAAIGALAVTALATWVAMDPVVACKRGAFLRRCSLAVGPLSLFPLLIVLQDDTHVRAPAPDLNPWGLPCLFLVYLIAAFSLIVLAAELRHRRSELMTWQGAAFGSAAASWSALALLMHCPGAEPQHLVVGHVLPICALPLLGLVMARHVLRLL